MKLGANSVISGLLGGAVGGLLGAIVAEVLYNPNHRNAASEAEIRTQSGIWVAIIGAVLGFVLLAWDGFTSGVPRKGFRDGMFGAAVGAVAGFAGGYLAQMLYTNLLRDATFDNYKTKYMIARVIAWGIFGLMLGVGLGIKGGKKKIINGLIGGTIGGAVGGLLFQLLENSDTGGDSGTALRYVGLTCTAVGIGLGVGLVERARRESWITINAGPMTGKEFILYKPRTVIGADYRCDIVLVRDSAVAPQHIAFDRTPQGTTVTSIGGAVSVNGTAVNTHRLRAGDLISVGASTLNYQERALSGPQA